MTRLEWECQKAERRNKAIAEQKAKAIAEQKAKAETKRIRREQRAKEIAEGKRYSNGHIKEDNRKRTLLWLARYRSDPAFYALACCRRRISNLIKRSGMSTPFHTDELIGCTKEILMHHIESQFKLGMSWENKGQWEIDHIRPCASFDLTDPAQQKRCFHYSNLQPLWAKDNHIKHDHWDGERTA